MKKVLTVTLHDGQVKKFDNIDKVWDMDDEYVVRSVTGEDKARFPKSDVRSYSFGDEPSE